MVAGFTMVAGLGLLALPVGVIATGFIDTIHRRDFVITFGMLARVPLFRNFEARMLSEILNLLHSQTVAHGGIIAVRGAPARAMYFIVSGEVEAEIPHKKIRFGPGDFFGELALLHETPRQATIVAVTQCRLLALAAEDFAMLIRKHPALKTRIEEAARERLKSSGGDKGDFTQSEVASAGKLHDGFREDD
jgi:voltage-gated potassium channel